MPGFLDIFRRKKETAGERSQDGQPDRTPIDLVLDYLRRAEDDLFEKVRTKTVNAKREIKEALSRLESEATALVVLKVEDSIYQQPTATVESSKDTISKKLLALSQKFHMEKPGEFSDLILIQEMFSNILKEMVEVVATHGRFLTVQFPDKVKKLRKDLRKLSDANTSLRKIVDDNRNSFDLFTKLKDEVTKLSDIQKESQKTDEQIAAKLEEVRSLRSNNEILRSELEETKSTSGFKEQMEIHRKIASLSAEITALEATFNQDFTPILKPLRKFGYVVGIESERRGLFDSYLDSPWRTLVSDKELFILKILLNLERAVENGRIEVKKEEKLTGKIEQLVKVLPDYQRKAQSLETQITSAESLLDATLSSKISNFEKQISENEKKIERMERDVVENEATQKERYHQLVEKKEALEYELSKLLDRRISFDVLVPSAKSNLGRP